MKKISTHKAVCMSVMSILLAISANMALADTYTVTVTNVTQAQSFTPRLYFTHTIGKVFTVGDVALPELATIAESGDLAPMIALLSPFLQVITDMETGEGLLAPGASETITIEGEPGSFLSIFNMLIPTNDAFIGINGVSLPVLGSVTYQGSVYDAGSETNDEACANIPGPVCGGSALSPEDDGEGYIYIHSGIHGIGDLAAETYDWNNPAVNVVITKM